MNDRSPQGSPPATRGEKRKCRHARNPADEIESYLETLEKASPASENVTARAVSRAGKTAATNKDPFPCGAAETGIQDDGHGSRGFRGVSSYETRANAARASKCPFGPPYSRRRLIHGSGVTQSVKELPPLSVHCTEWVHPNRVHSPEKSVSYLAKSSTGQQVQRPK